MKSFLRESLALVALSLLIALLYNAASPTGIRLDRKPLTADQEKQLHPR